MKQKDYYQLSSYEMEHTHLEGVVEELLEYNKQGRRVSFDFNGHMLYSDTVTMDKAFRLVLGVSKADHDREQEEKANRMRRLATWVPKQEPNFDNPWIQKGRAVLHPYYWRFWDEHTNTILQHPKVQPQYDVALQLIKDLNNGAALNNVLDRLMQLKLRAPLENLVVAIVEEFCDRGRDFGRLHQESRSLFGRIKAASVEQDRREASAAARKKQTNRYR